MPQSRRTSPQNGVLMGALLALNLAIALLLIWHFFGNEPHTLAYFQVFIGTIALVVQICSMFIAIPRLQFADALQTLATHRTLQRVIVIWTFLLGSIAFLPRALPLTPLNTSYDINHVDIPLTVLHAQPLVSEVETTMQVDLAFLTQRYGGVSTGRDQTSITLLNSLAQPILFPAETQYIATDTEGQEILFHAESAVSLPRATSTAQGVTFGHSNIVLVPVDRTRNKTVSPDTSWSIVVPGQQPIDSGNPVMIITVSHGNNDTSTQQYIPTEETLDWLRDQAIQHLFNTGLTTLREQADTYGDDYDLTQVQPARTALEDSSAYTLTMAPPLTAGQPVSPSHATIDITVRATFRALGVPREAPLQQQLEHILPGYGLSPDQHCGERVRPHVQLHAINWAGNVIQVSGTVTCAMEETDTS